MTDRKQVTIYLEEDLAKQLKQDSCSMDVEMSKLAQDAIDLHLNGGKTLHLSSKRRQKPATTNADISLASTQTMLNSRDAKLRMYTINKGIIQFSFFKSVLPGEEMIGYSCGFDEKEVVRFLEVSLELAKSLVEFPIDP